MFWSAVNVWSSWNQKHAIITILDFASWPSFSCSTVYLYTASIWRTNRKLASDLPLWTLVFMAVLHRPLPVIRIVLWHVWGVVLSLSIPLPLQTHPMHICLSSAWLSRAHAQSPSDCCAVPLLSHSLFRSSEVHPIVRQFLLNRILYNAITKKKKRLFYLLLIVSDSFSGSVLIWLPTVFTEVLVMIPVWTGSASPAWLKLLGLQDLVETLMGGKAAGVCVLLPHPLEGEEMAPQTWYFWRRPRVFEIVDCFFWLKSTCLKLLFSQLCLIYAVISKPVCNQQLDCDYAKWRHKAVSSTYRAIV